MIFRRSKPSPKVAESSRGTESAVTIDRPADGTQRRVTIVTCKNESEYVDAILNLPSAHEGGHRDTYPVLCDGAPPDIRILGAQVSVCEAPPSSHEADSSTSLFERLAATPARNGELGPCIVGFANDPSAIVAAAFARASGRCVGWIVDDEWPSTVRDASSVVITTLFAQLESPTGTRLTMMRRKANGDLQPFGLLTGADLPGLSRLAARIALRQPTDSPRGLIVSYSPLSLAVADPELEIRQDPESTHDVAHYLEQSAVPLTIWLAHSASHCGARGNLCSREEPAGAGDLACVNGMQCLRSEYPRVPARSLRSDIHLALSCHLARFGAIPGGGPPVATRLLDGYATAVFAPMATGLASPWHPLYLWSLAREGATLGSIGVAYEELQRKHCGVEESSYVLFGDPEARVFRSVRKPVEVQARQEDPKSWRASLPDPAPSTIETFVCRDHALREACRDRICFVTLEEDPAGADPLVLALDDPATSSVRIVMAHPPRALPASELRLTVTPPFRAWVLEACRNLLTVLHLTRFDDDPGIGFPDDFAPHESADCDDAEDPSFEFESLFHANECDIVNCLDRIQVTSRAYRALQAIENQILEAYDRASAGVLEHMRDLTQTSQSGIWLYSYLGAHRGLRQTGRRRDRSCARCGGTVDADDYEVGGLPYAARSFTQCGTCHMMTDHGPLVAELRLDIPPRCSARDFVEAVLTGVSIAATPARVQALASVEFYGSHFAIEPQVADCEVEPNERFSLRFRIEHVGDETIGLYARLKTLLLVNGSPAMVKSDFLVSAAPD